MNNEPKTEKVKTLYSFLESTNKNILVQYSFKIFKKAKKAKKQINITSLYNTENKSCTFQYYSLNNLLSKFPFLMLQQTEQI